MDHRTYKGGVKAYWKHRGYYRLDAAAAQRRAPLLTAELGGGGARRGGAPAQEPLPRRARRHRGWRVRRGLGRRVLRALSPRRWLVRLRDAYVSAMLRLASSPAVGFGAGAPYCTAGQESFARPRQLKEYDEKVLVEIYRSILARGGVPVAVPAGGPAATATAAAAEATTIRLSTAA